MPYASIEEPSPRRAPRVVTAVGRTLLAALGDGPVPDFTPPSTQIAFG